MRRLLSGSLALVLAAPAMAELRVSAAVAQPVSGKASARTATAGPPGQCRKSYGQGAAPTERLARLQAWERVAQATGNWPVATDTFRNETYSCAPIAGGWRCRSSVLVCRAT